MSDTSRVGEEAYFQTNKLDGSGRLLSKTRFERATIIKSNRFHLSPAEMLPGSTNPSDSEDKSTPSGAPQLDRSQAKLSLPPELVVEALRMTHLGSLSEEALFKLKPNEIDKQVVEVLTEARIALRAKLDPVAADLLSVINNASLMAAIDLSYDEDSSVTTIWATPKKAVATTLLSNGNIEFRPVGVPHLPYAMADIAALQSCSFVSKSPISISGTILAEALGLSEHDLAVAHLTQAGGLNEEHARLVLNFHESNVRHWQISSTWSTKQAQDSAEIKGLDAGDSGQWLVGTTGSGDNLGQITFAPQGPGDTIKAFRKVLPKNWVGTALNPPPV